MYGLILLVCGVPGSESSAASFSGPASDVPVAHEGLRAGQGQLLAKKLR